MTKLQACCLPTWVACLSPKTAATTQQAGCVPQTIIECLKQACTGELPPNTRNGQSFIHDPKVHKLHRQLFICSMLDNITSYNYLTGGRRDRGQGSDQAAIQDCKQSACGRDPYLSSTTHFLKTHCSQDLQPPIDKWWFGLLQLTQKKTALQFKTLDQTLQTFNRETGQKQALSYRCADIDRIVPSLMGVSKVAFNFSLLLSLVGLQQIALCPGFCESPSFCRAVAACTSC